MSHERPKLFETLEPPRGGLAGLRARVERESEARTRASRRWVMATASCLPLVVLGAILLSTIKPQTPMPERFRLARIAAGLETPPSEPMTIAKDQHHLVAAQRIPTVSEDVVFYLVASVEP
jgi:hypothetical protein